MFYKKMIHMSLVVGIATLMTSCAKENDWDNNSFTPVVPGGEGGNSSSSSDIMNLDELNSFTISLNKSTLTETEVIPTSEEDMYFNCYVENNFEVKKTTKITFNGTSNATVEGIAEGDTIDVKGGNVEVHAHTKGLVLSINGTTTNGSLKIYSDKKFELLMDNVSITNPEGSALNIQNGNCFIVLQGDNTLADGSTATYTPTAITSGYSDIVANEDNKAVLFSEDNIRFSGSGILSVSATNTKGKSGIASDDAIFIRANTNISISCGTDAGSGIKANENICIKGGVLNIEVAAAGKKGITSDGSINISGGRTTAVTTGGVDTSNASDPSGCAAIKADSVLNITGGELYLKSSGQGGKGISCDDVINISDGTIRIITEGSQYGSSSNDRWGGGNGGRPGNNPGQQSSNSNSVSPKGIRCDKDINISGGNILVRTSGSGAEGIESKATLTFSGGRTAVNAYDDGLNASKAINISGGYAFAISNGNCDGIDSNGSISATGGTMIGVASTMGSEEGIDLENSTFLISNANVISIGNGNSMGMGATYSGHYISTSISGNAGSYVSLCNGDTPLLTFALPRQYSNGRLLMSAASLQSGTYTLKTGVTPSGGTQWMNLYENVTSVSDGYSISVSAR